MAYSVNWATKVISIPKSDLTLLQSTPIEIRELNLNAFRLELKNIEDSEEGIPFPTTHNHNQPVTVGGVTLARVVELINGYTVTFEDGQYAVNLAGANSNVGDNINLNQVSVRASNSAGLVQTREIEYASFNNAVNIDTGSGFSGTVYPNGTRVQPVNNLADALLIAEARGFFEIHLLSNLTITTGANVDGIKFSADNWLTVTVQNGASVTEAEFERVSLYGVMSGTWNVLTDCWVYDITNFSGWVRGGSIGSVSLAVGTGTEVAGQSFFDNIVPLIPGLTSTLVMNTNVQVSFTQCADIVTIENMTAGATLNFGMMGGHLTIDNSCTGGTIEVDGVGVLVNNSGVSIDQSGLTNAHTVWDHLVEGGFNAEQILRLMAAAMAGKVSGAAGTSIAIRDLSDTKNRILATVDSNGNRTAVTLDAD